MFQLVSFPMQTHHWLKQQIIQSMRSQLTQHQSTHTRLETKLTALDPHAVLARGYAVVRGEIVAEKASKLAAQQTVVRSITGLTIGQTVELQLGAGRATAKIIAIDSGPIAD